MAKSEQNEKAMQQKSNMWGKNLSKSFPLI